LFLLEIMVLSIIVGYLRRGSLTPLVGLPFRRLYLLFFAVGIQIAIFSLLPGVRWLPAVARPYLHLLSYGLVILALWFNCRIPGFWAIGVGMLMNLAVIAANGGHMPVIAANLSRIGYPEAADSLIAGQAVNNSILLQESTQLKQLADIFYLPGPFPSPNVFSLGDVVIAAGVFLFFQLAMKSKSESVDRGGFR
jgi:hypothetical protein